MKKAVVDYSLYLVTDSTPAILGDRDICQVVEAALKGGVTIVQYRDKTSETGDLIRTAKKLHEISKKYGVPLLINDRIDVALAVGCEGVHIGQDDIDLESARRILGPDAIIGVTASSVDEATRACQGGADYLGVGTVFATLTKQNTKSVIGTAGLQHILGALAEAGHETPTVCIGGINASTIQRVLFQSGTPKKSLDGAAVVSAIMAADDPEKEAKHLLHLVRKEAPFSQQTSDLVRTHGDVSVITTLAPEVINAVHAKTPLTHNMTNLVVQNFAANVALAIGASPIMANYGEEAADLCKLGGALVINMGTVTPDGLDNYLKALRAYNAVGQPVVFDPVGAGATAIRRNAVKTIMAGGYLSVIKGNEGEIRTVWASTGTGREQGQEQQRGVDSSSTLDDGAKAALAAALAARERCVVVLTGAADYASDGARTFRVANGVALLGAVTGTGCVLGTAISACVAAHPTDRLAAAVAALLHVEVAAERAAARGDVRGPGSFVPALIDEIYRIRLETVGGELGWLQGAKVERVL